MGTQEPIGGLILEGRLPSEIEKDQNLLINLSAYMPETQEILQHVTTFFREVTNDPLILQRIRNFFGEGTNFSIDDTVLLEEAEHAKFEFVRNWVDDLLQVWSMWNKPAIGIPLNRSLLPDTSRCAYVPSDWEEVLRESREDILCNVALNANSLASVSEFFYNNINKDLYKGPIELPQGLSIMMDRNRKPYLWARTNI